MSEVDQKLLNALKDENTNLILIRSYLDEGADVNAMYGVYDVITILYKAVWDRNLPLIELLIEYQVDLDKETLYDSTPWQ